MSVMTCGRCGDQIDTDFETMYGDDEGEYCGNCADEERKEE